MIEQPANHPDLVDLDRHLGGRLERVLQAEQQAAGLLARRSATLRDRLLDAEDSGCSVTVTCLAGPVVSGRVTVVASDHLEVSCDEASVLIALDQVAVVDLR